MPSLAPRSSTCTTSTAPWLGSGGWRGKAGLAFEIDPDKLADQARFDGIFVLHANAKVTPLQAVLRYRDLLQVEKLFRTVTMLLHARPICHACDEASRGCVFCSFLVLRLRKELLGRWHRLD